MASVEQISELRKKTGAGLLDCKKALEETKTPDEAIIYLRKLGLADIQNKSARSTNEGMVGHYIHSGGKIAVLCEVLCETDFCSKSKDFQDFVKDVCMHVAASNPKWVDRSAVPLNILQQEKDLIMSTQSSKPIHVLEKIVDGKLEKFFSEVCLMDQSFVKNQDLTIEDLLGELAAKVGENIIIRRFVRFAVGEVI